MSASEVSCPKCVVFFIKINLRNSGSLWHFYKNKNHLTRLFHKIRNKYHFTLHQNVFTSASYVFQRIIHDPGSNRQQLYFNGFES